MNIGTNLLHEELLKMMKAFHEVCNKNHYKYYMLGGTCLGAVRHKGFIPWDDDMDVGMLRDDYERFCKEAERILPPYLELRFYKTEKNSPFHFIKLINKNTTLVERNFKNYTEGLYIDIFPLDGIRKYNVIRKFRFKWIRVLHALIMNHCYTKDNRETLKVCFEFFAKKIDLSLLHHWLEKAMTRECAYNNSSYLCNYLGAWGAREIIPAKVFGTPKLYQFEDSEFYGPVNADEYLKNLYGDYMQLPPENKRVCKHDYYYINLNKPYMEYMEK